MPHKLTAFGGPAVIDDRHRHFACDFGVVDGGIHDRVGQWQGKKEQHHPGVPEHHAEFTAEYLRRFQKPFLYVVEDTLHCCLFNLFGIDCSIDADCGLWSRHIDRFADSPAQ